MIYNVYSSSSIALTAWWTMFFSWNRWHFRACCRITVRSPSNLHCAWCREIHVGGPTVGLTCDHFDRETDDKTSNLGLPDFQVWVLALKSAWKSHGRGHNFGRGFPCGNNTNSPNLPEMRCDSTIQKNARWLRCVYHANYHYLHGVAFDSHSFLAKHQIGTWDHHSYPLIMSTVCYWTWP